MQRFDHHNSEDTGESLGSPDTKKMAWSESDRKDQSQNSKTILHRGPSGIREPKGEPVTWERPMADGNTIRITPSVCDRRASMVDGAENRSRSHGESTDVPFRSTRRDQNLEI